MSICNMYREHVIIMYTANTTNMYDQFMLGKLLQRNLSISRTY